MQDSDHSHPYTDGPKDISSLFEEFLAPPLTARPRAWWHWMDGNVDEAGIDADLEWLAASGAGGIQMFFGSFGTPPRVPEPVRFRSPAWHSAVRRAVEVAAKLGLEMSVATSAGWSATGGPWVRPAAGMKKIVWSATTVCENDQTPVLLPAPPASSGPYQDVPFTAVRRGSAEIPGWFEDVVVLAFPKKPGHQALAPETLTSNSPTSGDRALQDLADGTCWPPVLLHSDGTAVITAEFPQPVTVKSARIGLPAQLGFGGTPASLARLEASNDNADFWPVASFPPGKAPVRSMAFPPVTAQYFRVVLTPQAAGGPPVAAGIKPMTFPESNRGISVTAFELFAGSRVSRSEEKAGYAPVPDYYALEVDDADTGDAVAVAEVLDLSRHLSADGVLNWAPDKGQWTVMRFGYSLTGHLNAPAPAEATGLEVDKLDAELVTEYMDTYLSFFEDGQERHQGVLGIDALLSDSIESGPQNWTPRMIEQFEQRRGYSLLPWMPTLAGILVDGTESSDRFLWDFRKTISDLLAENHYGTISSIARDRGMKYYAEALEDHRPQLGDDLEMRSYADIPMGAMWCYTPETGPRPTYVADLRGAASVSHVYGKALTGAESMTAFGDPYRFTPKILKPVVDMEFALGANLINIHTSPHQPTGVPKPGITLAPYLGQSFSRNETWAHAARPWLDYMARCSHVLQQGTFFADIAYFYGEESPVTGVFGDAEPEIPEGYGFDFINLGGLTKHVTVTPEGELVTSGGTHYRLLYLGGSSRKMTLAALARIKELLDMGVTVAGWRPNESPSKADDPAVWTAEVESIWGEEHPGLFDLDGVDVQEGARTALRKMGLAPDWSYDAAEGFCLPTLHRTTEFGEIYFISNQLNRKEKITAHFRMTATAAELWDPYLLTRENLHALVRPGRTSVSIELAPFGSVFVLLKFSDERRPAITSAPPERGSLREIPLQGPWQLVFSGDGQNIAPITLEKVAAWSDTDGFTTRDDDVKYFSGTGTYLCKFDFEESLSGKRIYIDLGEVHDIAQVTLNGELLGTAWTPPFRVEATHAIRIGLNYLEVAVTNGWANRLAGDAAAGEFSRPGSEIFFPEGPVRSSGLQGPIRLVVR